MNIYTMVKKAKQDYFEKFFKGYYGEESIISLKDIKTNRQRTIITVSCKDIDDMRYCFVFGCTTTKIAENFKSKKLTDEEMITAIKEFFMNNVVTFYEIQSKGLCAS